MVINDPIGDLLARIRNAQMRKRDEVITPASKLRAWVLDVLQSEGFIRGYKPIESDDGKNILIRPLFYCRENLIQRWNEYRSFPIIPCNLCGSQDNLQRQAIKQMLAGWDKQFPGRVESIARSLSYITPSHMADPDLFDFKALKISKERISLTHID